eukprot:s309_g12.t1
MASGDGSIRVRLQHHKDRFEVTLPQDSRVSALAQEAARLTAVEPGRQRLICRGKVLSDASVKLETLLSKAGAELQVMLLPMESTSNQAKRNWLHYQRLIHSWLLSIWDFAVGLLRFTFNELVEFRETQLPADSARAGASLRKPKAPEEGEPKEKQEERKTTSERKRKKSKSKRTSHRSSPTRRRERSERKDRDKRPAKNPAKEESPLTEDSPSDRPSPESPARKTREKAEEETEERSPVKPLASSSAREGDRPHRSHRDREEVAREELGRMRRIARPAAAEAALRRPASRRRPAERKAEEEEVPLPEREEEARGEVSPEEGLKYKRGEWVEAHKVPPGDFLRGDCIIVNEAIYLQEKVSLALKIEREEIDNGERELVGELTGTTSEQLLRFGTSQKPCRLQAHLCRPTCTQARENLNLVHIRKLKKMKAADPKTWECNLIEEVETALVQQDQAKWAAEKAAQRVERKKSSTSSEEKKKKKKKKKAKRKREEEAEEGETRPPEKAKASGKSAAKKPLEDLYRGTGLDPCVKARKKLVKKVKKSLRRSKETSTSSTSSSSRSSTDMEEELLSDRSKVHRIATIAPGVLAAQSINQMKVYLTQVSGTGWDEDPHSLPPLLGLYNRTYVSSRLTGGVLREFTTLAWIGDQLLQGKPAHALDGLLQRMKALEMVSNGVAWTTSQKIEIVPAAEATMGTRQELQIARREAKLDQDAKGGSFTTEKGRNKGKEKGKGKDKGKGKSKEAEARKAT